MTELEAELEAELDQLTGGDSATMASQYSALDEVGRRQISYSSLVCQLDTCQPIVTCTNMPVKQIGIDTKSSA